MTHGEQVGLEVRWGGITDSGRVRQTNQDDLHSADCLFVVADGMGGHRGGEVAARIAVEVVGAVSDASLDDLVEAVELANRRIHDRGMSDAALNGMGTTVVALALPSGGEGAELALVNVGDSRAYRFRGDVLEQLTDDHSLVAEMVRLGQLTDEEAVTHPRRNIVTRAVGVDEDVAVDSWSIAVKPGDRYVLCSDGLVNELTDDAIAAVLRRLSDPTETAQELVTAANENGGRDNITVLIVDILDETSTGDVIDESKMQMESGDRGNDDHQLTRRQRLSRWFSSRAT
jgi:protein phosphatase